MSSLKLLLESLPHVCVSRHHKCLQLREISFLLFFFGCEHLAPLNSVGEPHGLRLEECKPVFILFVDAVEGVGLLVVVLCHVG